MALWNHRLLKSYSAFYWLSLATAISMTPHVGSNARCPVPLLSCICDTDVDASKVTVSRIVCTARTVSSRSVATTFPVFPSSDDANDYAIYTEGIIKEVSFIYAGLKDIPDGAFGQIHAENLDLQGNNLGSRISDRAFLGTCHSLLSLNLAWSNVTALGSRVFRGMTRLRNLSLAENSIHQLSAPIFYHLRDLRRLSLAGNPISWLPGSIFRYQTALETLDLGYCRLHRLPWTLFFGLWNLKLMDLRGNKLIFVEPYTFMDLGELQTLLLGHNPLRRLQDDSFLGLHQLVNLRLEESNIERISRQAFRDLHNLRSLDLGDNSIREFPRGTLPLLRLQHLSLDGNKLTCFPVDIADMGELRTLDLSYNYIGTIDSSLRAVLAHLDFLNLRENRLICDCRLMWLKSLRVDVFNKWRNTPVQERHHPNGPILPGQCASPLKLRGVGASSWVDLECLLSHQSGKHVSDSLGGRYYDNCPKPIGSHDNGIDFGNKHEDIPDEPGAYLYHPLG